LLDKFKVWLAQTVRSVLPNDTFGIAVNYALKHRDALNELHERSFTHWLDPAKQTRSISGRSSGQCPEQVGHAAETR